MTDRVDWVDVAKGFTIIMVVMMHSTLGVEKAAGATGWLHYAVEFARPFRMPDFFLIAGLFLTSRINAPWRLYLDSKILHFAYFYALWLTIQFAFKAPGMAAEAGWRAVFGEYLYAFTEPWGTLWFIYHLALFLLVTRVLRNVPWLLVWSVAAALEIAPIHTGSVLIDEFAGRFVYFYSGYVFASHVFRVADVAGAHRLITLTGLALWAALNALIVFSGYADLPLMSLLLGFAGAMAIIAAAVMLASTKLVAPLRWLGAHSIVVYLAFFIPMVVSRTILFKTGIIADLGTISLLVTTAGVVASVLFYIVVQRTGWGMFLFERPAWARLTGPSRRQRAALVPAE